MKRRRDDRPSCARNEEELTLDVLCLRVPNVNSAIERVQSMIDTFWRHEVLRGKAINELLATQAQQRSSKTASQVSLVARAIRTVLQTSLPQQPVHGQSLTPHMDASPYTDSVLQEGELLQVMQMFINDHEDVRLPCFQTTLTADRQHLHAFFAHLRLALARFLSEDCRVIAVVKIRCALVQHQSTAICVVVPTVNDAQASQRVLPRTVDHKNSDTLIEDWSHRVRQNAHILQSRHSSLVCPITQEIMSDPVIAEDGHSYERLALQRWFDEQQRQGKPCTSPVTNAELQRSCMITNHALRIMIDEADSMLNDASETVTSRCQEAV